MIHLILSLDSYVEMRKEARNSTDMTFTSARNLLAVLRLSTALARLRLSSVVEKDDISEAIRLIEMSKDSINHTNERMNRPKNPVDRIYGLIRELAGDKNTVKFSEILEHCTNKGFTPDQVNECVEEYEELIVWKVNQARTEITFI